MTIWQDDFTGGGFGNQQTWTQHTSTWTNVAGEASMSTSGAYASVAAASFADGYVQVVHKVAHPNGVLIRVTDENNFYMLRSQSSVWEIWKRTTSTFTLLQSVAQTPVIDDVSKLEVSGTGIEAFVNDISIWSGTDPDHSTGAAGLYGNAASATMDDWEASDGASSSVTDTRARGRIPLQSRKFGRLVTHL